MATKGSKRVYKSTVDKWLTRFGYVAIPSIIGIFLYLQFVGAINITYYSGDSVCAGNLEDPCYAYINFTAMKDIFIYPNESWEFYTEGGVE